MSSDPIMFMESGNDEDRLYGYSTPGWYHTDEAWAYVYGPFETRIAAEEAMKEYCRSL